MRFRLGFVTGMAVGYYMGTKAGRQRYDQINRALRRARRSETFQAATDRARSTVQHTVEAGVDKTRGVVEDKVDDARRLVETRLGDGQQGTQDLSS
ncbi:MAG: hypothetical protein ACR2HY_01405 [Acidimicrobiales bacterium]